MSVRRLVGLFVPLLLICICAGIVLAQGTPAISRSLFGGGGCALATTGNVTLSSVFGQPIAGPSDDDGAVRMMAGFWSGGELEDVHSPRFAYLPLTLNNYSSTWENCGDSQAAACQVGGCGTEMRAYLEDTDDWYYFDLGGVRNLTITAENILPASQLLLYDPAGQLVAHDGSSSSPKTVSYTLQRGYVRLYTPSGHNTTNLYTLALNCQ